MSKQDSEGLVKNKHAELTGYCKKTTPDILQKMASHPHKGDWRRSHTIRLPFKLCLIKWTNKIWEDEFIIKTPVPVGMIGLIKKNQTAAGRNFESLPNSVEMHFE